MKLREVVDLVAVCCFTKIMTLERGANKKSVRDGEEKYTGGARIPNYFLACAYMMRSDLACSFAIRSRVTATIIQRGAGNTRSVILCPHRSHRNLIHITPRGKSRRTPFSLHSSSRFLRRFFLSFLSPSCEAIITFALISVPRFPTRFPPGALVRLIGRQQLQRKVVSLQQCPVYAQLRISLPFCPFSEIFTYS